MALECFVEISSNSLSWLGINSRRRQRLRHSSFEALKMNTLRLVALLLVVLTAQASTIRKAEVPNTKNTVQKSRPKVELPQGARKPIHIQAPNEAQATEDSPVAGNPEQSSQPKVEVPNVISPVQSVEPKAELPSVISPVQPAIEQAQQPIAQEAFAVPPVAAGPVQSQPQSVEAPVNVVPQIASNPEPSVVQGNAIPQVAENPVEPEQSKPEEINRVAPEPKIPNISIGANVVSFVPSKVQAQAAPVVESEIPVRSEAHKIAKPSAENAEKVVGKVEGSDNQVVDQVQAEPRGFFGVRYPQAYYVVNPGFNGTFVQQPYVKPPFVPFQPNFGGHKGYYYVLPNNTNQTIYYGYHNKFGGYPIGVVPGNVTVHTHAKPGYFPFPLRPIPFWKSDEAENSSSNNDVPLFIPYYPQDYSSYDAPDFIVNNERVPVGQAQGQSQGQGQGAQQQQQPKELQLIGHIYIYKTPKTGGNPRPAADENVGNFEESDFRVNEPFGNTQLLLQPVYPANGGNNNNNNDNIPNQINEIYKSLHLVHPSLQQRSQSPAQSEDSSVFFAVDIPKPIYRFFKSIFGAFSK
ncbi:uncharacterized protein LOC6586494 [Drosophila mojavensis]|uniref:Uncharacterized protein n=1 Tax=Drosophila mojavensis TaxID=7230 RepID=B4L964_DROMO|nr:uncharacterized protein LOC6586494 [Drosophila mojavensis]EDW17239.2 uncharacterized protein Dmoj_GI16614 [Drosophila mojavensis]